MKISVIKARADDDIGAVVDYIRSASNKKVFLVLPLGNDLVYSKVGLKTLLKKAVELKKELIVSMPTKQAVALAKEIGLIATDVTNVAEVPVEMWKKAEEQLLSLSTRQLYDIKGHQGVIGTAFVSDKARLSGKDVGGLVRGGGEESSLQTRPRISGLRLDSKQVGKGRARMLLVIVGLLFAVLLSVLGSIFFIYYKFFPRVYVNVVLKALKIEDTLQLKGNVGLEGIAPDKGELGVYEIVITDEETISKDVTTETEDGTYAEGEVNVYNAATGTDAQPLHIPQGAVFISEDGKRFVSLDSGDVAPLEVKRFRLRATEFGEEYNIPSNVAFSIQVPGFNPDDHKVASLAPFTGGSKQLVKIVSKEEVDAAINETKDLLKEQLIEQLREYNRDKGYRLIEDSVEYEILETQVEPAIGEKAEQFTVTLKMRAKAYFYREEALKLLLEQMLVNKAKEQSTGKVDTVGYSINELQIKDVKIKVNGRSVEFEVGVSALLGPKISEEDLRTIIRQQPDFDSIKPAIEQYLNGAISTIEVGFNPEWIPKRLWYIPDEDARVTINIRVVSE